MISYEALTLVGIFALITFVAWTVTTAALLGILSGERRQQRRRH